MTAVTMQDLLDAEEAQEEALRHVKRHIVKYKRALQKFQILEQPAEERKELVQSEVD